MDIELTYGEYVFKLLHYHDKLYGISFITPNAWIELFTKERTISEPEGNNIIEKIKNTIDEIVREPFATHFRDAVDAAVNCKRQKRRGLYPLTKTFNITFEKQDGVLFDVTVWFHRKNTTVRMNSYVKEYSKIQIPHNVRFGRRVIQIVKEAFEKDYQELLDIVDEIAKKVFALVIKDKNIVRDMREAIKRESKMLCGYSIAFNTKQYQVAFKTSECPSLFNTSTPRYTMHITKPLWASIDIERRYIDACVIRLVDAFLKNKNVTKTLCVEELPKMIENSIVAAEVSVLNENSMPLLMALLKRGYPVTIRWEKGYLRIKPVFSTTIK